MITYGLFPLKKLCLWSLFVCYCLITAYIIFICMAFIWQGLNHLQEDGFWMPILVGGIILTVVLWLFLRFSKFIYSQIKEKETFDR